MGTFSSNINKASHDLFEGITEYNDALRQTLTETVTVNNPLGKTCQITFGSLDLNLNFFNLPFQKSPLNYNLFDKFLTTSYIVEDINSSFIKIIDDLQCCDLAKNYNSNILPLFMWFIGDAGDKINHPEQYDSSRKDNGFLPILIEVAKNLMQAYEPIKNLTCIMRPVPGNPWMKSGGMDWLKPIYNTVSEIDFVMKTILNGDYLDILIEPLKQFRDQLITCTGKYRGKLVFSDNISNVAAQQLKMQASIQKAAASLNTEISTTNPPTYPESYYTDLNLLEELTIKVIDNITASKQYQSNINEAKLEIGTNTKTITANTNQITELNGLLDFASNTERTQYLKKIKFLESENSKLTDRNVVLTSTIETLTTKVETLNNLAETIQYNEVRKKVEKEEANYQIKLNLYMAWFNSQSKALQQYQDCLLLTKVLIGDQTDNSCNCLLSMLNIFIPLPEPVNLAVEADVKKILDRLPYSQTEISNLRKNEYVLISIANMDEKLPGKPTLLYQASWRNAFNSLAGTEVLSDGNTAATYFTMIDQAATLKESLQLGEKFLTQKKNSLNKKIKIDLEVYNRLQLVTESLLNLKMKKTEELIKLINLTGTIQTAYDTVTLNINKEKTKLKQDLDIIEDLLTYQTSEYFRNNQSLLPEISFGNLDELQELEDKAKNLEKDAKNWSELIKLNTRVVVIIGKDNIPCDCSILCKLIQYVVDLIMSSIKEMFNRIVQMILNSVMTKEMAYLIKFIKAKLQCLIDILAIPENLKMISNRAKQTLEAMQQALQYATEPAFCNKDGQTKDNSNPVIPINNSTNPDIIKTITDYNITDELILSPLPDGTTPFPYPNTSGGEIVTDSNSLNNNKLIIRNLTPGKQFEFRNIPTLFFDCSIQDQSLQPVFDIITPITPERWSVYFSFKLTPEKLNQLNNFKVTIPISSNEQKIKDMLVQELSAPSSSFDNPLTDLDITGIIEAAKEAATVTIPAQYAQKIEDCTSEQILNNTQSVTPCGYTDLNIVSAELGNPTVNSTLVDFVFDLSGIEISLKNLDQEKFNIPIKIKAEKIFEDTTEVTIGNYTPEISTIILLVDFYDPASPTVNATKTNYSRKPQFDANLYYGRYPYLDIGYRSDDGVYHFPTEFNIPDTNFLDSIILKKLCDIAITNHKVIKAEEFQPTEEQIAKKKEINLQRWEENNCGTFPQETQQTLENQQAVINNIIKPLLIDITQKMNDKAEWIIERTPTIDDTEIKKIINAESKVVEYGIPLLELNKDLDICVQIIQVESSTPGLYQPMVNVSNFNFLSDILNINDNNNIPMIIEPDLLYFMAITFDGAKYEFTLIDEKKVTAKLIKLKTNQELLFPSRFGRMTDPLLVNQTFCGTIYDLGIANTIIDPAVYYKFSMMNFNPKSELFVDFETNIDNNFYSSNDLPAGIKYTELTPEVKYWLEQTYLKGRTDTNIPYFIYNKYISAHTMVDTIRVEGNRYKNALKESFITNFYCKESIMNKSFTMSFWFKRLDDSLAEINPERMVLISDTRYFNNFYYNKMTSEFILELNNKNQIIKIPKNLINGDWYNLIFKFDHLLNKFMIFITSEPENQLNSLYVGTPISQFKFNLISLLAEFDFNKKDFTNFYPCLIGNVIMDTNLIGNQILEDQFSIQKLCFKGL